VGFHKRYINDDQIIDIYRKSGCQAVIDWYQKGNDAIILSGDLSEHVSDILSIGLLSEVDKWNRISEVISNASIEKGFDN